MTTKPTKRQPMKPIPGWLVMFAQTGPADSSYNRRSVLIEVHGTKREAIFQMTQCDADFVVPVEIRERPNPRRAAGRKQ